MEDANWLDAIRFYALPLAERRKLLLHQREWLRERQNRLEQQRQELEARQMRLEQQQHALKTQLTTSAQHQEAVSAYHLFGSFRSCPIPLRPHTR